MSDFYLKHPTLHSSFSTYVPIHQIVVHIFLSNIYLHFTIFYKLKLSNTESAKKIQLNIINSAQASFGR